MVLALQAGGAHESGRPERGELQELAPVERALRRERAGVGATVRWEGLHGAEFTLAPPVQMGGAR